MTSPSTRPKLAVVAGDLVQPRFLALFEALQDAFDVCVYALQSEAVVNLHGTSLKLRLFDVIEDMPGYMRGLEEELAGSHAVIGLETSRLATFQAVRAARKFGVPLGVVVTEFQPYFYERFANIRAIQFDICHKSDRFWATSRLAAANLVLDEVPATAISLLNPVVNQDRFRPDAAARAKFRDYVGLRPQDFVVLFRNDLEAWHQPEEVLRAVHLLYKQSVVKTPRLKLIFAGNGALAKDLKYQAVDLGLARSVLFLHQDPEPFLGDLYNACDVIAMPRALPNEFHEELPLALLEAMACGVAPLVRAGSIAAELAGAAASDGGFADDAHPHIAAALQRFLQDPVTIETAKLTALRKLRTEHAPEAVRDAFVKEVWDLIHSKIALGTTTGEVPRDLGEITAHIRVELQAGREHVALTAIEEALMFDPLAVADRAELLCCKGEAYLGLADYEQAALAFHESLKLHDRNPRCIRGLGFIAWHGHAHDEALAYFKRAHGLQEDDPQTMLGIGLVYRRLGLVEEAIYWLEKCLAHQDYPPAALSALAQTCAQASRGTYGIKVLERALDVVGEHKMLLMTLGQLCLNEGFTERGQALLERAAAVSTSAA